MRTMVRLLIALLVIAGALAPIGQAQDHGGLTILLTDAVGDVKLHSEIPPTDIPVPRNDLDLVGLDIEETPSELLIYIRLAKLPDPSDSSETPEATFSVRFAFNEVDLFLWIPFSPSQQAYEARLQTGDRSEDLAELRLDVIPRLAAFVAHVPREVLAAAAGTPPVQGMAVTNWRAESLALRTIKRDSWLGDDANADLSESIEYRFVFGTAQNASFRLSSPTTYVVSNGLATSYPIRLLLENDQSGLVEVHLRAANVPPGWQVTLPSAPIRVEPQGRSNLTFVLTVPFGHQHGGLDRFRIDAVDASETLASLDMGVIYTAIPQPAGHHNTLYIHSGVTGPYMNTLEEDEADTGQSISKGPFEPGAAWRIPLEPVLGMGLDFDLERTGTLEVTIGNRVPAQGLTLTGTVRLIKGGTEVDLATIESAGPSDGQAMQETTFQAIVTPTPDSELVQFTSGTSLVLDLQVTSSVDEVTTNVPPDLLPGGRLTLPLFDYHDDVDAALRELSGLSWTASATQLRVPPGGFANIDLTLDSLDGKNHRVSVLVDSDPEGMATFNGASPSVVNRGNPLRGTVGVHVPADAFDGQLLDVVVVAQDESGSGALAVQRIAIVVDSSAESAIDPLVGESKDSPSMTLVVCLLALAVAVLARRNSGAP